MSENIFSNLYNRVLSFFQKDRMQDEESSKDTATNRLKLVLMQDRSNLDGATMQKMREQLITVISKYIEIDKEALDLNLEADGDEIALMLNIPVIRARTKEEIEEIEAKEQETLKALKENSDDSDSDKTEEDAEESNNTEADENDSSESDDKQNIDDSDETLNSEEENTSDSNEDETQSDENNEESETDSVENKEQKAKKSKKDQNN